MTRGDLVRVLIPEHCDIVFQGSDGREVFDRMALWIRRYYADVSIIGLSLSAEWEPDPGGLVPTDERPVHLVTLRFTTGAQRDLDWRRSPVDGECR